MCLRFRTSTLRHHYDPYIKFLGIIKLSPFPLFITYLNQTVIECNSSITDETLRSRTKLASDPILKHTLCHGIIKWVTLGLQNDFRLVAFVLA